METSESRQAYAIGMKQYWGNMWKPGKGFRLMDSQLENALGEEITNLVYSAISAGYNMDEVMNSVFQTVSKPTIDKKDILYKSIKESIKEDPDLVFDELFNKTGIWDVMVDILDNKNPRTWNDEIDKLIKDMQDFNAHQIDDSLIHMAEQYKVQATAEGFTAAVKAFGEMNDLISDMYSETANHKSRLFQERIDSNIKSYVFDKRYRALENYEIRKWKAFYDQAYQTVYGLMIGLGVDTKESADYVTSMRKSAEAYKSFYEYKLDSYKKYQEKTNAAVKKDKANEEEIRKSAYIAHLSEQNAKYSELVEFIKAQQALMDQAFVIGYQKAVGSNVDISFIGKTFNDIAQLREAKYGLQKQLYEKIGEANTSMEERLELNKQLRDEITKIDSNIRSRQQEIYDFMNLNPSKFSPDPKSDNGMGLEDTLNTHLFSQEAVQGQNEARERERRYMDRKDVEAMFMKSKNGKNVDAVRLTMFQWDAAERKFYRDPANKGKNFYQDFVKMIPWTGDYARTLRNEKAKGFRNPEYRAIDFYGRPLIIRKNDLIFIERLPNDNPKFPDFYRIIIEDPSNGKGLFQCTFQIKQKLQEVLGLQDKEFADLLDTIKNPDTAFLGYPVNEEFEEIAPVYE